jgi:hypothetical protein
MTREAAEAVLAQTQGQPMSSADRNVTPDHAPLTTIPTSPHFSPVPTPSSPQEQVLRERAAAAAVMPTVPPSQRPPIPVPGMPPMTTPQPAAQVAQEQAQPSPPTARADQPVSQPPPVEDAMPIQILVMQDIQARMEHGITKYGTALMPFNGRDGIQDAYEEALDLAVYIRQCVEEQRLLGTFNIEALTQFLDQQIGLLVQGGKTSSDVLAQGIANSLWGVMAALWDHGKQMGAQGEAGRQMRAVQMYQCRNPQCSAHLVLSSQLSKCPVCQTPHDAGESRWVPIQMAVV